MKKILFVSHCILNTASKVVLYNEEEIISEEFLRKKFLGLAIEKDIQIIQLPCPEFTLYGAKRWGHVSNQFNNVFFRNHCKNILNPILDQLMEYLSNDNMFQVLGIVGIDGSPSCGVDYTCTGDWYGAFDCRKDLNSTLSNCKLENKSGVFILVLKEMLDDRGISDRVTITSLFALEPEKCISILD